METIRRYDIDWLRVIAIGLLIIYHVAITFQPWGVFIGFIQNEKSLEPLWIPMSLLNVWRIPILFFVSGMGVYFAMKKRNWKQLIGERLKRILLPFLFGMLCIVPLHILIWQNYYNQDIIYSPVPGHLWFLGNIFIYVIILSPVFFLLQKNKNSKLLKWSTFLFKSPIGLIPVICLFVLETIIVKPEPFELYAMTLHGFVIGLLAFFFGFYFVFTGKVFWETILKWRWLFTGLAFSLFLVRFILFELKSPNYLTSIEACLWIFSVFGFSYKYLDRPSKTLAYLSQAAYPVYIIHMIYMYLGAVLIVPLNIPAALKFILLSAFTITGCFITYEFIKRISILRPLFGLKTEFKARVIYKAGSIKRLQGLTLKKR